MLYKHKNNILLIEGSIGKVYRNQELLFKGNSYVAIKLFIKNSDNNESVSKMFEAQLTMREKCRFDTQSKYERMNPGVDHDSTIYTDAASSKTKTQKRKRKGYD
jgi:hypothetical protein